MGFLIGADEVFLAYPGQRKAQTLLRRNAVRQLAKLLKLNEKVVLEGKEVLKHGTEVESHAIARFSDQKGAEVVSVDPRTKEIIESLSKIFPEALEVQTEFAAWLIELIPHRPFERLLSFKESQAHFTFLNSLTYRVPNTILLNGPSVLPFLGAKDYYRPPDGSALPPRENKITKSQKFHDETITNHSRYYSFSQNTPLRHQGRPEIRIPVFQDARTTQKAVEFDTFALGMCNSAFQITYSLRSISEARFVYDQLHVLAPVIQSLSNSTFAADSLLLDWDSRYDIIAQSTDDRKPGERLNSRRYDPIVYYISNDPRYRKQYNDLRQTLNRSFRKALRKELKARGSELAGDKQILNHYAGLFVREYLNIFPKRLMPDYEGDSAEFEMIQSSNWNDVRFKPPGSFESVSGFKVEFRPMDTPVTSREKAALVFFVTLMVRILSDPNFDANFYIPMSLANQNFKKSILRDSHVAQKFHFRTRVSGREESPVAELSVFEILNGSAGSSGLRALVGRWVEANRERLVEESKSSGEDIFETIDQVFDFFSARASGELKSNSQLFRSFVLSHKDYKQDSVISPEIMLDLIRFIEDVQNKDHHDDLFKNHLKSFAAQK